MCLVLQLRRRLQARVERAQPHDLNIALRHHRQLRGVRLLRRRVHGGGCGAAA
jgi:hypothetical protein